MSGPNPALAGGADVEEARIRAAYARRRTGWRDESLGAGDRFILARREHEVLALLRRHGCASLDAATILEVGCGNGRWLRDFVGWGARPENVIGLDLLPERVAEARRLCPPGVRIEHGNAARLPFADGSFDIVLQSTVFTSILDSRIRRRVASEMLRVLKPGGFVLWYDFRISNPLNRHARGVERDEIGELFPACQIQLGSVTLLPPLARLLAPWSQAACTRLERLPLLRTHYLGVIEKT